MLKSSGPNIDSKTSLKVLNAHSRFSLKRYAHLKLGAVENWNWWIWEKPGKPRLNIWDTQVSYSSQVLGNLVVTSFIYWWWISKGFKCHIYVHHV